MFSETSPAVRITSLLRRFTPRGSDAAAKAGEGGGARFTPRGSDAKKAHTILHFGGFPSILSEAALPSGVGPKTRSIRAWSDGFSLAARMQAETKASEIGFLTGVQSKGCTFTPPHLRKAFLSLSRSLSA